MCSCAKSQQLAISTALSFTPSPPKHNALVYFIAKLSAGFGEPYSSKGEPARHGGSCREMPSRGPEQPLRSSCKTKAGSRVPVKAEVRAGKATPPRRRLAAASRRACRCTGRTDGATGRANVSAGGVVRRSCPPDAGRCRRPCARASPPARL